MSTAQVTLQRHHEAVRRLADGEMGNDFDLVNDEVEGIDAD